MTRKLREIVDCLSSAVLTMLWVAAFLVIVWTFYSDELIELLGCRCAQDIHHVRQACLDVGGFDLNVDADGSTYCVFPPERCAQP